MTKIIEEFSIAKQVLAQHPLLNHERIIRQARWIQSSTSCSCNGQDFHHGIWRPAAAAAADPICRLLLDLHNVVIEAVVDAPERDVRIERAHLNVIGPLDGEIDLATPYKDVMSEGCNNAPRNAHLCVITKNLT